MDSDSDDDEDITGLISKPPTKYIPPARYISRHRNSIKSDLSHSKSAHLTLGVPNVSLNPPEEYLKKQSRTIIKRDDINHKHYHRPDYQHKLPSWEPIKRSSKSINGDDKNTSTMNSVDFKKRNISNVKKSQPSMPRMYYVDDRRGSSFPLLSSGLVPRHINYDKSNSKSNQIKKITNENKTIKSLSTDKGTVENVSQRRSTNESKKSQNLNTTNRESTRDNSDKLINIKKKQTSISTNDSKKLNNNTKKNSHQSKIVKSDNEKLHDVMKNNNQSKILKSDNEKLHDVMKNNDQSTILKSDNDKLNNVTKNINQSTILKSDNERSMNLENNKKRLSSSAGRRSKRESNCHFVTEEERAELLLGMKNKWDELMKKFQSLPFLSDTPPKAKRKSMLEEQLKQLEKDIDNIQRHPYIYVYDNDNN